MSEELDRRAALAMGWHYGRVDYIMCWHDGIGNVRRMKQNWRPSTDRNDLAELLREVERRLEVWRLVRKLKRIATSESDWNDDAEYCIYYVLTSDPAVICLAAVEVLEANNG